MRIALIAPPFIPIPPRRYGGTELFLASLGQGLRNRGHEVVVYANGESEIPLEVRSIYPRAQWPTDGSLADTLKELNHMAWAAQDAADSCDIIHVNSTFGLLLSRFVPSPVVYTVHHPHDEVLSEFYSYYPEVSYVTISDCQRQQESMPKLQTIHHGIDMGCYACGDAPREYLSFLGRIAPIKGPHLAIEAAKKAGIPLKIAGEIQPVFRDYFDSAIRPHLDGTFVEYVGEADLAAKNELLGHSLALLFPITWDEPFGLVMIEAMACGAPVLALAGGSVREVVQDGVSGYICNSVEELARCARQLNLPPASVRLYAEQRFSLDQMSAKYEQLYRSSLAAPLPGIASPGMALADTASAA